MKTGNLSLDQAPPEDIPFRFMITGPAFGVMAGIILAALGERIFITAWSLDTVALTHLITLGWLTMIMMGAIYQMIPVLVGGHVPGTAWCRHVYYLMLVGILALVTGFLSWKIALIIIAPIFLASAVSIFVCQLMLALFRVKANRPVVYAMRISVICLALAVTAGVLMVGILFSWWDFPIPGDSLKYIHITLGLLGWVTLLIFGVGFHVIPMFFLTKSFPDKTAYGIIWLVLTSLVALTFCFGFKLESYWLLMAGLPAFGGMLLFVITVIGLLQQRQRKMVDTTLRFWQLGLTSLLPAALLLPVTLFRMDEIFTFLFAVVFLLGFAMAVTNGMLYKIIPFLVWLHRFSALVGRIRTPAMKEIVRDLPARIQFYIFGLSLVLLIASSLWQNDILIRFSGAIWSVSSLLLLTLLLKAIRIRPPESPPVVAEDDFAAMFKDLPPPPSPKS